MHTITSKPTVAESLTTATPSIAASLHRTSLPHIAVLSAQNAPAATALRASACGPHGAVNVAFVVAYKACGTSRQDPAGLPINQKPLGGIRPSRNLTVEVPR